MIGLQAVDRRALTPCLIVACVVVGGLWGADPSPANLSPPIRRPSASHNPAFTPANHMGTGAAPLYCAGPHDLNVQGETMSLGAAQAFDRVCVIHGGTLDASRGLRLRAGLLYVDASSRIDAGPRFLLQSDDPCPQGPEGPGADLSIDAREAILQGRIVSDGAPGYNQTASDQCAPRYPGVGGAITLTVGALTLAAPVAARGGAGGYGTQYPGGDTRRAADGAPGGTVTIRLAAPIPAGLASRINVRGGAPLDRTHGHPGPRGRVSIAPLSAAQAATLPPAPPPLVAPLGVAAVRIAPESVALFARDMGCGAGDLSVGSGERVSLDGPHHYRRVCIHDGGVVQAGRRLTLRAQTILVDAPSRIEADGAVTGTAAPATGRYRDGGSGAWPRTPPHAGVPGPNGTDAQDGTPGPRGGAGGGALALIARRVLIAGTVSAEGTRGGNGGQGQVTSPHDLNGASLTQPAGGGSGGGIFVRADALYLTGLISAAGGDPGVGGDPERAGPPPGGAGAVTLLTDRLEAPAGDLPVDGAGLLGHTLPVDPAPPPADPGALDVAATGHTIGDPFLPFWRRYGGATTLGYPLTEAYSEGGRLVQYTERCRLEAASGGVVVAPLGRQLTIGRHFAPVAPFASAPTRRYFSQTGHSLSGLFLAYWQAHDGVTLLGAAISEPLMEGNGDGSGRRYLLQWFERGRLEYHAENAGTPYVVQSGLLGKQALQQRGWRPRG